MASETRRRSASARRRRARGRPLANPFPFHGDPRKGAADAAPTAPHATAPEKKDGSGPARFWSTRRLRIAGAVAFALSLAVHVATSPWDLLPDNSGLEFKDPADELTIPVDLLGEDTPPPPEPPPPPSLPAPSETDPNGPNAKRPDAGAPKHVHDAGIPDAAVDVLDAGVHDASSDAHDAAADASPVEDGGEAPSDGGLVAAADAGAAPGANGPRDPGSMIGMAGIVTAGQVNVTLLVNVSVIRKNPVGARIGPLLFALPQWNDFIHGADAQKAGVDPIRDTDWILIYGPSLIHTERDAVLVHYSAPDELVDKAVDAVAMRYDRGGPFDAGVPGIKASLGHADNAERVFLRVQPHVLAVVPKDKAGDFARALKRAPIAPKVRPGEAMRLTVVDPWKQIAIPGLKFDRAVNELRLWIVPRPDGGADAFTEGDCTDELAAEDAARALTDLLRRQNSVGVRIATRGLLNDAKVVANGKRFEFKLAASRDQLEAILQIVGAFLGANVAPPSPPP